MTKLKKKQVKYNDERGFFLHNWFVLGSYDELNLYNIELEIS